MARSNLVVDSAVAPTLALTAVIPVMNGAVTGDGEATAGMVTLTDLSAYFVGIDGPFFMNTATATPSAFAATSFDGFSSTVSGAAIMGFGTTNDVTLMNRAGTPVLGVVANTTGVTAAGAFTATGKLTVTGTVTAAGAVADGTALTVTPTAAANNDVLTGLKVSVAAGTPGSFTGLVRQGISVPAFTVVGDTSPGNPVGISVGIITGTGASVASALSLAPPTGATTNYLLRHTTAATFNVTGAGALTAASVTSVGGFGCNGTAAQTAVTIGAALAVYGTGVFGLDSDANMQALYNDVVAIRAALVANGILVA